MTVLSVVVVVGMVMTMRDRIHRRWRRQLVVDAKLLVVTRTGWHTQHCSRDRAPDRKQHGKQYQEPDAKRFH